MSFLKNSTKLHEICLPKDKYCDNGGTCYYERPYLTSENWEKLCRCIYPYVGKRCDSKNHSSFKEILTGKDFSMYFISLLSGIFVLLLVLTIILIICFISYQKQKKNQNRQNIDEIILYEDDAGDSGTSKNICNKENDVSNREAMKKIRKPCLQIVTHHQDSVVQSPLLTPTHQWRTIRSFSFDETKFDECTLSGDKIILSRKLSHVAGNQQNVIPIFCEKIRKEVNL